MTKNRFGNGGSRGGRSARGKRRNEAQRAASRASAESRAANHGAGATEQDAGAGGTAGRGSENDPTAGTAADSGSKRDAASNPASSKAATDQDAAATGEATGVEAAGEADSGTAATDRTARSDAVEAEQLDQFQGRIATLQDELLRKQADFENFRKRINRDKEEAIKFANTGLLLDLTAVLDDFERAISAAARSEDFATLHSGIELIEKQLLNTLQRKWGLTRFDSAGQPFDPERHEALATEPSDEHTEVTVIEDYQKGYTLHGRVIRAARVRVATPLERAAGDNGSATETDSPTETGSPTVGTEASLEEGA